MRHTTLIGGLVLLCLAVGSGASPVLPPSDPPDPPRPPPVHFPGIVDMRRYNPDRPLIIYYEGRVTALTAATITLQVYFTNSELTGGSDIMEPPGRPPRRFKLSAELSAGKVPAKDQLPSWGQGYGRDDVRVGDVIELSVWLARGDVEDARYISIRRRPGGRVPPDAYERDVASKYARHTRMNAYNDFEERGTRLPEHFDRTGHTSAYLQRRMARIREVLGEPPE
jgi:hypothetical protein